MDLEYFQVDAFTDTVFAGNPAVVYPLDAWLPEETMQSIAAEHNLSETVFFVANNEEYHIRWFTPVTEVPLCGHATLACAHVIFSTMQPDCDRIRFSSQSGPLSVLRTNTLLTLDFPATPTEPCEIPQSLVEALGVEPAEVLRSDDYLVVLDNEKRVTALNPDMRTLAGIDCRGICVTAPGESIDFVSRFFAPRFGIDEDPVTGSAHCMLTPYWSRRLGKVELTARQLSKRGGMLWCRLEGDRVAISGNAVTYSHGTSFVQLIQ